MAAVRLLALFTVTALLATAFAEIRFRDIRSDSRSTIPIDGFGFTHTSRLQLSVSKFSLSYYDPKPGLSQVGFLLCTCDSWIHALEEVINAAITCPFQSTLIKPVFT
ncbi:hypothetical protein Vadar_031058 [Vaccinium darrowii]|uniref:Uncharacterized protein n=1 Tax=Vaccinium darrowii TaxID=229202 RepID=A0ACB7XL60_9ERIC|nr:hypothetical protein Vadar_031058 [Vaccinium darrowii]